ncbi:Organic anion transporter polypeptide OATP [Trinorchestia longiramus]|nr:Organic anion transporter polypeptide OATP [Trinorchestia longiramus]
MSRGTQLHGAESRLAKQHDVMELATQSNTPAAVSTVESGLGHEGKSESGNELETESGCGWHLCFSSRCVRHSRTAKWLLFWMCCAIFTLSMMINGFMNVNVTTIEKRYQLKSRNSGLIISSWDIGSVSLVAPLSYMGSRPGTSKPRLLGTCMLVVGLGCYVAMLPHFLVAPYEAPRTNDSVSEDSNLCHLNSPSQSKDFKSLEEAADAPHSDTSEVSNFLYMFIFASYITGLFSSPLYPVGSSFIDESVAPDQSALYLGILMTAAAVGPSIAFGLGGQLLTIFIDAPNVDPADYGLTPSSDRWLGAWWIGYGITGTLSILTGLNLLMIPRVIPRKERPQMEENEHSVKNTSINMNATLPSVVVLAAQKSSYEHLDEFMTASKTLLSNVTYVLLSLAKAGETFIFSGIIPFLPKFIETQFGVSAGLAAMSMGGIGLLGGAMGTLMGGWLIKHFKMSCKSVLRFCFFVTLSCTLSSAAFLIRCPNTSFAGVTTAYPSFDYLESPNITSSCNADCSCSDVPFSPVCGANNVIYFSPCHAGCTQSTKNNDQEIFSKCACVEALPKTSASTEPLDVPPLLPDQAVINGCPSDCGLFWVFLCANLILFFLGVLTTMPYINGTMRCVAFDQRAYAMGLQGLPFCLLGTVPGPIVYGAVIDKACLLWSESSTSTGACVVYDNYAFGRYIFALSTTVKVVVVFLLFGAWWWYDDKSSDVSEEHTTKVSPRKPTSSLLESVQKHDEGLIKRRSLEAPAGHTNQAFTHS